MEKTPTDARGAPPGSGTQESHNNRRGATGPPGHLIDDYALDRIAFRVRQLSVQFDLGKHEQEDCRQDMVAELLSAMKRFDPDKASRETFINRVLDRYVLYATRVRCTAMRRACASPLGLDDVRRGYQPRINDPPHTELDEQGRRELRLDLETAMSRMPPDLQQTCQLLTELTPAEAAKRLGLHRRSVYRRMDLIHQYLDELGLNPPENPRHENAPAADVEGARKGGTMKNTPIDLDVLATEPADVYHAKAGEHLSSHQLLDFMRCPLLYRRKQEGLVPDEDRPAYLLGRAAHVRILEGPQVYQAAFALGGPVNPDTGKPYGTRTKAFAAWAEAQGKPVLSHDQVDLIERMAAGVAANDEAIDLLLCGRAEGVVRAEYCGVPCQARLDWLHPQRGIVDLKTCDDLTYFEADARRYGYHRQLAFYRAVLGQVLGNLIAIPVHLIAIEKREPFRCGVWRMSEDTLRLAQQENEAAIRRLAVCRERDRWPTGYEEVRVLDVA